MDRFLQNTNIVRLIAIILAIILWFAVGPSGESTGGATPTYSKSFTGIPVTVIHDNNQYVVSNSVAKVNVIVSGGTFDITQLQTSLFSIKAIADIRGYSTGMHQVALSLQNIPDTLHSQIIPDVTTVVIDQKVSKSIHVKVGVVGQPKSGYTASTPALNLTDITVTGPLDSVNKVANVQAIISVDGADNTIQKSIPLVAVDEYGNQVNGVELSSHSADVTIPIHPPTKDLKLKAVTTGDVKDGYSVKGISISPAYVTMSAPSDILANLGTDFTLPAVDISGLDQDKTFTVPISKPDGVQEVQPTSATVTVKVVKAHSLTFSVPVTFANVPDGLKAQLQENFTNVDITVTGSSALLSNLTADQIGVYGDLSGLAAGVHEVTLQANVPDGIQVVNTSPGSVHVNLVAKS